MRIDKPQLEVEIDRGLADTMDIDVRSMSNELQAYLGGTKAGVCKEDGYRYDIRVMAERAKRSDAADIGKIYFKTGAGDIIQAPGVLSVRKTLAPNVVSAPSRYRRTSRGIFRPERRRRCSRSWPANISPGIPASAWSPPARPRHSRRSSRASLPRSSSRSSSST